MVGMIQARDALKAALDGAPQVCDFCGEPNNEHTLIHPKSGTSSSVPVYTAVVVASAGQTSREPTGESRSFVPSFTDEDVERVAEAIFDEAHRSDLPLDFSSNRWLARAALRAFTRTEG